MRTLLEREHEGGFAPTSVSCGDGYGRSSVDNKDAFQAARILVDFIRDFTLLTEQQLMSIRHMMEETVQEVMSSVNIMSSKADEKRHQASGVLVQDHDTEEFRYSATRIQEEVEQFKAVENGERRREFLENQLRRAGGVFSKHMEALHTMDTELQEILFKVMGAVSMDDVMGQRLSHVIGAIHVLQNNLSDVISNYEKYLNTRDVKNFRNRVLTEVYRSYTAEEEKEIFHRIFGYPKEAKTAS
jgi:hypothetical protein